MSTTSDDRPDTSVPADDPGDGDEISTLLEQAQRSVAAIAERAHTPPTAVRVVAGDVRVEAEWATPAPAPAAAAPVAAPAPAAVVPRADEPDADDPDTVVVAAPAVGVFYRAPEPGAAPFVSEGDEVVAEQQVAIVEAMKLMIPVKASAPGRVRSVVAAEGAAVAFGDPLVLLERGPADAEVV